MNGLSQAAGSHPNVRSRSRFSNREFTTQPPDGNDVSASLNDNEPLLFPSNADLSENHSGAPALAASEWVRSCSNHDFLHDSSQTAGLAFDNQSGLPPIDPIHQTVASTKDNNFSSLPSPVDLNFHITADLGFADTEYGHWADTAQTSNNLRNLTSDTTTTLPAKQHGLDQGTHYNIGFPQCVGKSPGPIPLERQQNPGLAASPLGTIGRKPLSVCNVPSAVHPSPNASCPTTPYDAIDNVWKTSLKNSYPVPYENLEVNRIEQPGPIPHPDKNFRPYGINNWHVILLDHKRLRYLSNSEIKEIRDHVGEVSASLQGQATKTFDDDGLPAQLPQTIGDGPYTTDDTTQVWKYCQAYLSRRGQMRNNNAARRSRMKKESETYYWKMLALQAGVRDHEYVFTEEEEQAACARAEEEKLREQAAAAGGSRPKNSRKRGSTATGARGQRAAKRMATADSPRVASPLQVQAGCLINQAFSMPSSPGQMGGLQNQHYQDYAPARDVTPSPFPQQTFYGQQPPQVSPVQPQGEMLPPPRHHFNTHARARAAENAATTATVAPIEYENFTGTSAVPVSSVNAFPDTTTTGSVSQGNNTIDPILLQLDSDTSGVAAGSVQVSGDHWLNFDEDL